MTIRGLLLDFYGTVVEDDDTIMMEVAARVAAGASRPVTAAEVMAAWSCEYEDLAERTPFRSLRACSVGSLATVMAEFGCPGDAEELCAGQYAYWAAPPLRPGTRDFLSRVELPICVVSDADHDDLLRAIDAHGLSFAAVVCSERVGAYKPDPAMFAAGLAALGLGAHEVLHVGDSLRTDIEGAHAAGIRTAWVNRRGLPRTACGPAAFVISDLSELDGCLA
ncbi:HAD family hydrolase [Actinoplanes sp. CA-030573]|uniref:HAD family hydrolase n=1 Tax=Actinoplanes sp. CA-030573 TaxID=3239898 RepID=UPI003D90624F